MINSHISISMLVFLIGFVSACLTYKLQKIEENKVDNCKCISTEKVIRSLIKYEIFIDSLNNCKKSQKNRLVDSANKYRSILKFNPEIEYY